MIPRGRQRLASQGQSKPDRSAGLGAVLAAPAAVLPLLPGFGCPVCLTAYTGILSSAGLGIVLTESVLRPVMVTFLVIAVASVAWGMRRHGNAGPTGAAVAAALGIIAGRIVWSLPPVVYAGVACLVLSGVWNLVLLARRSRPTTLVSVEAGDVSKACSCCRGSDRLVGSRSGERSG